MKRVFSRITATILISATLAACAPMSDSVDASGSVRVMAPVNGSNGDYSLALLELSGISNLATMTGKFVRFFMSPRVTNNRLDGISPRTRFVKNSQGVFVPADEITSQMAVIYAHMQKLAALDEELGAGGVNKWPRDIGVAVRVRGGIQNNAFYDGKTDSMLFVPYTRSELPISVNAGILAHEHFHSLFYKIVLGDSTAEVHAHDFHRIIGEDFEDPARGVVFGDPEVSISEKDLNYFYHMAVTRGLNEGLADFWGWMYTGDPDFIARSLKAESGGRSLKVSEEAAARTLINEIAIKRSLKILYSTGDKNRFLEDVNRYAYSLGTQFSRTLKRFTDIYANAKNVESLQARKDIAKVVIKILPLLREELANAESKVFTTQRFVELLAGNTVLSQEECVYLSTVANAVDEDEQTSYGCKEQQGAWSLQKTLTTVTDNVSTP